MGNMLYGYVTSFHVGRSNDYVVMEVTTEDGQGGHIQVPKAGLQQMLDAQPLFEVGMYQQTVTPRN